MQKPYHSIPPRRSAIRTTTTQHVTIPDIEEDERYYLARPMPRSALRYRDAQGHEVIQRGKQRLVIHTEEPPPTTEAHPSRRSRTPAILGGMVAMLVLILLINWLAGLWTAYQLNAQYGFPRTWQTDVVVGHHDSATHPSHFLIENLSGHIIILEIPGEDVSHARIYSGPTLSGPDAASIPVTGSFQDRNGDGKPDLILHIGDQTLVYLNDGIEFKPQS